MKKTNPAAGGESHRNMKSLLPALAITIAALCAVPAQGESDTGWSTGEFQRSYTMNEIAGAEAARAVAGAIEPDEPITWELYVPAGYDPRRPAGILVYISPTSSGEIPAGWRDVLDDRNLIWVGANDAGNRVFTGRRAVLALMAARVVARDYAVDPERLYVTGLSGGGKMAGKVAADYPGVFRGAIFNCGIDPLDRHPPRDLDTFRQNHFVFVTGTWDQAEEPTIKAHRNYLDSGVTNVKLMVIPKMTHRNPDSHDFAEALDFLDSRLVAAPGAAALPER